MDFMPIREAIIPTQTEIKFTWKHSPYTPLLYLVPQISAHSFWRESCKMDGNDIPIMSSFYALRATHNRTQQTKLRVYMLDNQVQILIPLEIPRLRSGKQCNTQ